MFWNLWNSLLFSYILKKITHTLPYCSSPFFCQWCVPFLSITWAEPSSINRTRFGRTDPENFSPPGYFSHSSCANFGFPLLSVPNSDKKEFYSLISEHQRSHHHPARPRSNKFNQSQVKLHHNPAHPRSNKVKSSLIVILHAPGTNVLSSQVKSSSWTVQEWSHHHPARPRSDWFNQVNSKFYHNPACPRNNKLSQSLIMILNVPGVTSIVKSSLNVILNSPGASSSSFSHSHHINC